LTSVGINRATRDSSPFSYALHLKIDCWSGAPHLLSAPRDLPRRWDYPSYATNAL